MNPTVLALTGDGPIANRSFVSAVSDRESLAKCIANPATARYSDSNVYAVTHMDSVFGWEAMEAEPLFSTQPIVQTKLIIPDMQPMEDGKKCHFLFLND